MTDFFAIHYALVLLVCNESCRGGQLKSFVLLQTIPVSLAADSKIIKNSKINLKVLENATSRDLQDAAFTKQMTFNPHLMRRLSLNSCDYMLCYPSMEPALLIPGTSVPFSVNGYKEEVGLPYQRLSMILHYGKSQLFFL